MVATVKYPYQCFIHYNFYISPVLHLGVETEETTSIQTTRLATAVKVRAVEASVLRLHLFCSIY